MFLPHDTCFTSSPYIVFVIFRRMMKPKLSQYVITCCFLMSTLFRSSLELQSGSDELEYLRGLADELENFKGRLSSSIGGLEKKTQIQAETITALVSSSVVQPRDCQDVQNLGFNISDIYTVYYKEGNIKVPVRVYCDMETDGGGWLVFQRRRDGQEDFHRTWDQYAEGFGDLDNEFWLGNYHLYRLTAQGRFQLRVDLGDFEGAYRHALYNEFSVGKSRDKYPLTAHGYGGDAGNSFASHNGKMFSARDRDFDTHKTHSCAKSYKGGWWYGSCHSSNLNGLYHNGTHESYADGVNWKPWHGYHYSLKFTEMKFRPAQ